jgi:hypothetical protein
LNRPRTTVPQSFRIAHVDYLNEAMVHGRQVNRVKKSVMCTDLRRPFVVRDDQRPVQLCKIIYCKI